MLKIRLVLFMIGFCLSQPSAKAEVKTVVLDAGHSPINNAELWGATRACQPETLANSEAALNDKSVGRIESQLASSNDSYSYNVILTHKAGEPVKIDSQQLQYLSDRTQKALEQRLKNVDPKVPNPAKDPREVYQRAAIGCESHADMVISIHHDDAIDSLKERCGSGLAISRALFEKNGYHAGYAVFVYEPPNSSSESELKRYKRSREFASILAANLKHMTINSEESGAVQRLPSNHHSNKQDCQSCKMLNDDGVWHQNLILTRESCAPAVVVEVGLASDRDDERLINTDSFRTQFAQLIQSSLRTFFDQEARRASGANAALAAK